MASVLVALGILSSAVADVFTLEDSVKHIQSIVKEEQVPFVSTAESLCDSFTCCNVSSSESCNLSAMVQDESTVVLPGEA